ncbi:MAG: metal ABC transporter ATP-binding protein [Candidatus Heimdallarchaeaceae archaeon]
MNDTEVLQQVQLRKEPDNIVCLRDITVAYGRYIAIYRINIDISKGEFIGIAGPNGSGKTTLLKTILGLTQPIQGEMSLYGRKITGKIPTDLKFKIGYVPQFTSFDRNFPALVEDVVMMGRYGKIGFFRRASEADHKTVEQALQFVGMEEMKKRPIGHLSGGQQQKVMIAQALATSPDLLLLDEPTSALDFKMTRNVMDILKELNKNLGITIVTINHNLRLLKEYTNRVIALNRFLVYDGPPQDPEFDRVIKEMFYE